MKATGLNHVSIHARDLETSTRFYEEFFGMRRVATPDFGYPVQWLEVGELQIHLFVRPTEAPQHHHFSLDVDDYGAAYTEARRRGILQGEPRRLPDGAVQMYIRDPAGNRVEMDWPDASTLDPALFGELESVPGPPEASVYSGRLAGHAQSRGR
jgi:catechol 2,3-dioxygenase-like lactoylglutathione lyase family enzyme